MTKTYVYADPHFGHKNIVKFTRNDGSPLRPWNDIDEHDSILVDRFNSLVRPDDRVYILGDLGSWRTAQRLLGRKVLVKGNHDTDKLSQYSQVFDDIRAYVVKKGIIMSHIPIHPGSMGRWQVNIHGHLHDSCVVDAARSEIDPRYCCVSVERTDFYPVDLQKLIDKYVK